ncbi:hypothetical protein SDJN03_17714, partial [Cucurbita argyrosperma subsp. sororia]
MISRNNLETGSPGIRDCFDPVTWIVFISSNSQIFRTTTWASLTFLEGSIYIVSSMASMLAAPTMATFRVNIGSKNHTKLNSTIKGSLKIRAMRIEKPLEELYNVRVERKVSEERLSQLGVSRWSTWKTGKCKLPWDWQADQLVYIEEGEVRVVPEGSKQYMSFVAGDLVRYPKWFEADLFFNGPYQERYCFKAYGDDY